MRARWHPGLLLAALTGSAGADTCCAQPIPLYQKAGAGLGAGAIGALIGSPADLSLIRMQSDSTLPPERRRNYKARPARGCLRRSCTGSSWSARSSSARHGLGGAEAESAWDTQAQAQAQLTQSTIPRYRADKMAGDSSSGVLRQQAASHQFTVRCRAWETRSREL